MTVHKAASLWHVGDEGYCLTHQQPMAECPPLNRGEALERVAEAARAALRAVGTDSDWQSWGVLRDALAALDE